MTYIIYFLSSLDYIPVQHVLLYPHVKYPTSFSIFAVLARDTVLYVMQL